LRIQTALLHTLIVIFEPNLGMAAISHARMVQDAADLKTLLQAQGTQHSLPVLRGKRARFRPVYPDGVVAVAPTHDWRQTLVAMVPTVECRLREAAGSPDTSVAGADKTRTSGGGERHLDVGGPGAFPPCVATGRDNNFPCYPPRSWGNNRVTRQPRANRGGIIYLSIYLSCT
jgi:hypothetical protein